MIFSKNDVSQILKSKDIRPTLQRIVVYKYLLENRIHPSIETIYSALISSYPSFSKTTIYNSVNILVANGLVQVLTLEGGFLRYDANVMPHGHFKCEQCNTIYDFELEHIKKPSTLDDYIVKSEVYSLSGICKDCSLRMK